MYSDLKSYSLEEIKNRLRRNELPFSGKTILESAEFHFLEQSNYAGVTLHAASRIRPQLLNNIAVSKKERFYDEDPFTEQFIRNFPIKIIALDSRFEYDLNRNRDSCIYKKYKKKWNLKIWNDLPSDAEKQISYLKFDEFYGLMDIVNEFIVKNHKYAFLFDMHSFCYQRHEKKLWYKDELPEINIGTKASNRKFFKPAIEQFRNNISKTVIDKHKIRVAENEIFKGGYLSRRTGKKHYNRILTFALEYKKIFMDELSGKLFPEILESLILDFESSVDKLLKDKTLIEDN